MRIQVLGAGVNGLSCAIALRERGHDVSIRAADRPSDTTSAVAAALWLPFALDTWTDAAARWARESFDEFVRLQSDDRAGVRMREVFGFFAPGDREQWSHLVRDYRTLSRRDWPIDPPAHLTARDGACRFEAPVIDTSRYLPWLTERAGAIDLRPVASVDEPFRDGFDLVVNCTGLGARETAGDRAVHGVEGQVAIVAPPPSDLAFVDEVELEPHGEVRLFTYVVPRTHDVVLGGTLRTRDGTRAAAAEPDLRERILERGAAWFPALRQARFVGERTGLRPVRRGGPRVGLERRAAGPVVHDYGHGGCGVSLAWGCAREVARLVDSAATPGLPAEEPEKPNRAEG